MVQKSIYFGRFISVPTPAELLIRSGAVLVVGGDGGGTIEEVDWEVKSAEEAKRKFGGQADVVLGDKDGFFFPGFIGMLGILTAAGIWRPSLPLRGRETCSSTS